MVKVMAKVSVEAKAPRAATLEDKKIQCVSVQTELWAMDTKNAKVTLFFSS